MSAIEVEQAQAQLATLIHRLAPGEELTLTEKGIPVAKLTGARTAPSGRRLPGLWSGKAVILAEDEEHLKDFAEHME